MKTILPLLIIALLISLSAIAQNNAISPAKEKQQEDLAAENMILWQRYNGGWPKDTYKIFFDDTKVDVDEKQLSGGKVLLDYNKVQTEEQQALALKTKTFNDANIDNSHTVSEIRYLLKAYKTTKNSKYLQAAQHGIDYLLKAQFDNGGWPMFYPDKRQYKGYITFNDNAMTNVMNLMLDITLKEANTDGVDKSYIPKAEAAFKKGVDLALKTQLKVSGKPAVWCAQYNPVTLEASKARAYELPSLSGSESVDVVRTLMRIKNPGEAVITSVKGAIDWFNTSKIVGYKTMRITDTTKPTGKDVVLVADANAVLWARFYDLETNKPFFCDRDGIKRNNFTEISNERRTGYSWYGSWAMQLLNEEYPAWLKRNNIK